jgi:hypothetical protein
MIWSVWHFGGQGHVARYWCAGVFFKEEFARKFAADVPYCKNSGGKSAPIIKHDDMASLLNKLAELEAEAEAVTLLLQ